MESQYPAPASGELCGRSRLFRLQGDAPAGRRRSELGPARSGSGRRVAPAQRQYCLYGHGLAEHQRRPPLQGLQRIHRHRVGVRFQLSLAAGEPPQELRLGGVDRRVVHLLEDAHRQRFRPQQRPARCLQLARWRIRTGSHRSAAGTHRQLRIYAAVPQSRARPVELRGGRMAGFRHRRCVHRAADYNHHLWRRSRWLRHRERRPSQLAPRPDLRPESGGAAHLWRLRAECVARPGLVQYRLLRRRAPGRRAARQCGTLHGSRSWVLQFGYFHHEEFQHQQGRSVEVAASRRNLQHAELGESERVCLGEQYQHGIRRERAVPRRAPHPTEAPRSTSSAFLPKTQGRLPPTGAGLFHSRAKCPGPQTAPASHFSGGAASMCCVSGQSALSGFITISVSIVSPLFFFGP